MRRSTRRLMLAGALLAFTGVALGAFGAHAVKPHISADDYDTYRIAAQYHLVHALAVFVAAYVAERLSAPAVLRAGWFFLAGVALFSGSLYLVATTGPDAAGGDHPPGRARLPGGLGAPGVDALEAARRPARSAIMAPSRRTHPPANGPRRPP